MCILSYTLCTCQMRRFRNVIDYSFFKFTYYLFYINSSLYRNSEILRSRFFVLHFDYKRKKIHIIQFISVYLYLVDTTIDVRTEIWCNEILELIFSLCTNYISTIFGLGDMGERERTINIHLPSYPSVHRVDLTDLLSSPVLSPT